MADDNAQFATLMGGVEFPVTMRDGGNRFVKVRKVAVKDMPKLAAAWMKEDQELLLYTGLDDKFLEEVSDESWEALVLKGRELNSAPFGRYWERQQEALNLMGQGVQGLLRDAKLRAASSGALTSSSPKATPKPS